MSFETEIVREGLVEFEVPKERRLQGPGRKSRLPFYNPLMATNRDVSVLVALAILRGGEEVLDGLTATGIGGIRIATEVEGDFKVLLNDRSEVSHDLVQRNIERNQLANCTAICEDLNKLLATQRFDLIDIDPFGTPVPFVEGAVRAIRNGGVMAATATDTAVLCGARRDACVRRYDSRPLKTEYCHELGLRILIGYLVRTAAKFDRGIEPLVSFSIDHYFRTIVRVTRGAERADSTLEKLRHLHIGPGLERKLEREPGRAGPLWGEAFLNQELLDEFRLPDYFPHKVSKLLEIWREEASSPPLFFTTAEWAKSFSIDPPPINTVIDALTEVGFVATRTHFRSDAFKTNADIGFIEAALRT